MCPTGFRNKHTFLDIEGAKILVILVAAASMICLYYFVERTKSGKAMRAVAEDAEIAALMGINVNRTIVKVFALGGAMAGIGRHLVGDLVPQRDSHHRLPPRYQGIQRGGGGRHRPSRRVQWPEGFQSGSLNR